MIIREVVVENAAWHLDHIENAAARLLKLYSQKFETLDSSGWESATERAMDLPRGYEYRIATLNPSGFDLLFVGPRYTTVDEENIVFWKVTEPRIELVDQSQGLLPPRDRNRIHRVSDAIAEEMMDVCRLEVLHDPLRFTFPKAEYAELRFNTGLLFQRN